MTSPEDALDRAREVAGGSAPLARALGIGKQAVWQWKKVPWSRVLDVERLTGVSRHELRPDVYPERNRKPLPEPTIEKVLARLKPKPTPKPKFKVLGVLQ